MGNEKGTWIMYGVSWNDPYCIHTVEEAIKYIDKIGFLPLFKNDIPGFSLEERTVPEFWWCDDPKLDPWKWREIIARSGKVAYGKFFDKKAGFVSKKWLPHFVNFRRNGYDFDALWDDEKASMRQKKIMDLFAEEHMDDELYSFEIKRKAGFNKDGEKNFEGIITGLQMQTYLCLRDFRSRRNKAGEEYGWPIAVYATPEHIFGADLVTSCYSESPEESKNKIIRRIKNIYPIATDAQIKKVFTGGNTPWSENSPTGRIYEAVKKIPKGMVATYGKVAEMAGDKKMARAVGNALHKNPDPENIPCYRVVNSKGELAGEFAFGGAGEQAKLLRADGIEVVDGKVDLKKYGLK